MRGSIIWRSSMPKPGESYPDWVLRFYINNFLAAASTWVNGSRSSHLFTQNFSSWNLLLGQRICSRTSVPNLEREPCKNLNFVGTGPQPSYTCTLVVGTLCWGYSPYSDSCWEQIAFRIGMEIVKQMYAKKKKNNKRAIQQEKYGCHRITWKRSILNIR